MARSLSLGCTGDDVAQLQRDLKSIGYYLDGEVDGDFGPMTDAAVRQLQLDNGMAGDGYVGPNTRAVIAAKQKEAADNSRVVKKPKKKKKKSAGATHEMGRWHGYRFLVSPTLIRSFTGLQVKTSCELESRSDNEAGIAVRKQANPTELSFTAHFYAYTGCNVRDEAYGLILTAQDGAKDYLYIGGRKIITYQFMCTEATLTEIEMAPNGTWKSANVQLTMKQCTWN